MRLSYRPATRRHRGAALAALLALALLAPPLAGPPAALAADPGFSQQRFFGSIETQHLLDDPEVVVQGDRVLHLRFRVRR